MDQPRLHGLVAAAHAPFHTDGALNLAAVEPLAKHLLSQNLLAVFINGSTGESHSLAVDERLRLAERWAEVLRGTPLRLVVHVGANCLEDARVLAAHAERLGVSAISALAPSYFKPRSLDDLITCSAQTAAAAPQTPFYFYDIPTLTGVNFSMPEYLARARERIPTLVGLKFTNSDFLSYQLCLNAEDGRWDVPWGVDEWMLAAFSLGARGAVGSSYNFAAPVYQRLLAAFAQGALDTARREQFRSARLIHLLAGYGYLGAAKALMGLLGVPVGPPRLPNGSLSQDQVARLRGDLELLGFFEWLSP